MKLNATPIHPLFAAIRDELTARLSKEDVPGEDLTLFVRSMRDGEKLSLHQYDNKGSYFYARLHLAPSYDMVSDTSMVAVFRQLKAPGDEYAARRNIDQPGGPNFHDCPTVRESNHLRMLARHDEAAEKEFVTAYVDSLQYFFTHHETGALPEFDQWKNYQARPNAIQQPRFYAPPTRMINPQSNHQFSPWSNQGDLSGRTQANGGGPFAGMSPMAQQARMPRGGYMAVSPFSTMCYSLDVSEPLPPYGAMNIELNGRPMASIEPVFQGEGLRYLPFNARPVGWQLQPGTPFGLPTSRRFDTYDALLKYLNTELDLPGYVRSAGSYFPVGASFDYVPLSWQPYIFAERAERQEPTAAESSGETAFVGEYHTVQFPKKANDFLVVSHRGRELARLSPEFEGSAPADDEAAATENVPAGWLLKTLSEPAPADGDMQYAHLHSYEQAVSNMEDILRKAYEADGMIYDGQSFKNAPPVWQAWLDLEKGMTFMASTTDKA